MCQSKYASLLMRVLKFVVFEVKECGKLNVFTIFNNLCACQLIRLRDFVMFKCSFGEHVPKYSAEVHSFPKNIPISSKDCIRLRVVHVIALCNFQIFIIHV